MNRKLEKYCEEQKITMIELAEITGVSRAQLFLINKDPMYNVTITTIQKIYIGTKSEFGTGLRASEYLDYECLKLNK